MDHFGIGQALYGMALGFFTTSRATGRTTSLLDSLRDGDVIICSHSNEAKRLDMLCHRRKLKVVTRVVPPNDPHKLFEHGTPQGRTVFDHGWVEEFYLLQLENARKAIDHWQRESSGWGEAHRQTQYQAEQRARWDFVRPSTGLGEL